MKKTYKDFHKYYIGSSDIAALIVAGPQQTQYLKFGQDGDYDAYFINEKCEIPPHYEKVFETYYWLRFYDDTGKVKEVRNSPLNPIIVYRAGYMGTIIYAPCGKIENCW